MYELPTVEELLYARHWLQMGAPSASRDFAPKQAVHILYKLMEALPKYLPQYAYGTEERKRFTAQNKQQEKDYPAENEHFKRASMLMREYLYDGAEPYAEMVFPMAQLLAAHERMVLEAHKK